MKKFLFLGICFSLLLGTASANNGNAIVLAVLKKNPVVNAAVVEAKKFSGASKCKYDVKTKDADGFEKGMVYDYVANIECTKPREASGIVIVKGRWSDGLGDVQPFELELNFAE